MASDDKETDKRAKNTKKKILLWFKNPYNLSIFAILFVSLVIRLYYFILTKDQPLWWDEADYMNISKTWGGIMDYPVNVIRPMLLPLIIFLFQFIGIGEVGVRFFILATSLASVFLIYLIGKLFFNEKVGLFSAIMLSIFWSFNFFSFRILVDVPLTFLWLLTIYVFFRAYFNNKNWKHFLFAGIFLGLSFLMKFTSAALIVIFVIYLLTTERLKIFKNKNILIFFTSAFLTALPYFIWAYFKYGNPLAFYTGATKSIIKVKLLPSFFSNLTLSVKMVHTVIAVLFVLGILWFLFEFVLMFDSSLKKKSKSNRYYFLILWLVLSLIFLARLFSAQHAEERYYFIFYPVMFIIAAKLLFDAADFFKKYSKPLSIILVIIILGIATHQNLTHTDEIIKIKKDSFIQLKLAGEWIKANTSPGESFLVIEESAETVYYAERKYNIEDHTIHNKTDLFQRIEKHNPQYIVLSFYYYLGRSGEGGKEMLNYIFSNQETFPIVQTYGPYIDQEGKLPLVVIVQVNNNSPRFIEELKNLTISNNEH